MAITVSTAGKLATFANSTGEDRNRSQLIAAMALFADTPDSPLQGIACICIAAEVG